MVWHRPHHRDVARSQTTHGWSTVIIDGQGRALERPRRKWLEDKESLIENELGHGILGSAGSGIAIEPGGQRGDILRGGAASPIGTSETVR